MSKKTTKSEKISRRKFLKKAGLLTLGGAAISSGLSFRTQAQKLSPRQNDFIIEMGEYYYKKDDDKKNAPIKLEAGNEYLIKFENAGINEHQATFGKDPDLAKRRYRKNLFTGEKTGFQGLILTPGQEALLHLNFGVDKKGEWEIGCFIPGHYEAGMKAPFIIE